MATLTDDAQGHLERYLRQVRAALRAHPSVDASEIERDIRGHIDAELAGEPEPIAAASLYQVLDRLGTPDQWVPGDDVPVWRRVLNRLRSGPEDWRLAYLTLAFFLAAPMLFVPMILWPLPLIAIVASFLLARATLAVLAEHGDPVGARGWLIYPPLLVWYLGLAAALFAWPVPPVMEFVTGEPVAADWVARVFAAPLWPIAGLIAALALGLWWFLLGLLLGRFKTVPHVIFRPFADWFDRRHGLWIALAGGVLALGCGAILFAIRTLVPVP